jgi:hypothetical protein
LLKHSKNLVRLKAAQPLAGPSRNTDRKNSPTPQIVTLFYNSVFFCINPNS